MLEQQCPRTVPRGHLGDCQYTFEPPLWAQFLHLGRMGIECRLIRSTDHRISRLSTSVNQRQSVVFLPDQNCCFHPERAGRLEPATGHLGQLVSGLRAPASYALSWFSRMQGKPTSWMSWDDWTLGVYRKNGGMSRMSFWTGEHYRRR